MPKVKVSGKGTTLPTGVQGDVLYNNGTLWTNLGAGTSGQFLQTLGAAANPQWATVATTYSRSCTLTVAASNSLDIVNADYVCDGVADEVQINAALNALPAAGGCVCLMEGTFTLAAAVTIPGNDITLSGTGKGTLLTTTANIVMIAATARSTIIIRNLHLEGTTASSHGIEFNDVTNSIIEGCEINETDGNCIYIHNGSNYNKINNNICNASESNNGIYLYEGANYNLVSNNSISNCTTNGMAGIKVDESSSTNYYNIIESNHIFSNYRGIIFNWDSEYSVISNNLVEENSNVGISIESGNSQYNSIVGNVVYKNTSIGMTILGLGCTCTGNTVFDNSGSGIRFEAFYGSCTGNSVNDNSDVGIYVGNGRGMTITGNSVYKNNNVGIHVLGDATNVTLSGNVCYDNSYHQIRVEISDYISVVGNNVSDSPANFDGIYLDNGSNDTVINGNICENNGRYGININNANCNRTLISGNNCVGNGTDAINDSGTDSQIFNNYED